MNNLYDVHSWSKFYREDALREARVRHLADRARPNHTSGGAGLLGLFRRGALATLLRGSLIAMEWVPRRARSGKRREAMYRTKA